MDSLTLKRVPVSADPEFIPLRLGEHLTPEQLKALFPKAQVVIQQIAKRVAEAQTAAVGDAS
jgi:hypothetical protein